MAPFSCDGGAPDHWYAWDIDMCWIAGRGLAVPSGRALRGLRRRVGAAPLKALFEVLAGPLGQPSTPGVRFGRYRTVACDGCRSAPCSDDSHCRIVAGATASGPAG